MPVDTWAGVYDAIEGSGNGGASQASAAGSAKVYDSSGKVVGFARTDPLFGVKIYSNGGKLKGTAR